MTQPQNGFDRTSFVETQPHVPPFEQLAENRVRSQTSGQPALIDRQNRAGKMRARERVECLLDVGSFEEMDGFVQHQESRFNLEEKQFLGDSVVTGWGTIEGRPVCVFSQDFTRLGGSVGRAHANKICKMLDIALKNGVPIIGINDSGGARIQEGVVGLGGYGDIFLRNTLASGVIPQISVILGPCAGGAVYSPALTDFVVMAEKSSHMFVTGPDVVESVTGERVTQEQLGGAAVHSETSGVAHMAAANEYDALWKVRKLLSYIPSNNLTEPPLADSKPASQTVDLNSLLPESPGKPYDVRQVISAIVDSDSFFEIHAAYAENIVVGLARLDGRSVGIVANQPQHLAGVLDIQASRKGARFVRFCDAFNIPLIVLEDVPGFLPGVDQEHGGIIREGAKLLYAFCEATVPKITVVLRKAYGGAYLTMNCKHIRSDLNLAWPSAELAVMGPEGAVKILYRRDLKAAHNADLLKASLVADYRETFANPWVAAEHGYIDDVIEPSQTRARLCSALKLLQNKRDNNPYKKHGNIPL